VAVSGAGCNGTRRLEKEDASAQGVLVNSTNTALLEPMQRKILDTTMSLCLALYSFTPPQKIMYHHTKPN
jgi:hypothetical protein